MQNNEAISEIIQRVTRMEKKFDAALAALKTDPEALRESELLKELLEYYEGGLWLQDYECDDRKELPKDLKRGVLSQDGIYNLLWELGQ